MAISVEIAMNKLNRTLKGILGYTNTPRHKKTELIYGAIFIDISQIYRYFENTCRQK